MNEIYSTYHSEFSQKLNSAYYWFQQVLLPKFTDSTNDFLQIPLRYKLVGLCEKDNPLFGSDAYFATSINVDKQRNCYMRISESFIKKILDTSLGESEKVFTIDNLTELEAEIITGFNEYIFNSLRITLSLNSYSEEDNHNLLHMTFCIRNGNENLGKIVFSVPISLIPKIHPKVPVMNFSLTSFPNYKTEVNIIAGKSRIGLSEVQNLEKEDIVVLESSNIKMMLINACGNTIPFGIKPNPALIESIDNGGKDMPNPNEANQNMWDVIPVEITAEFDKTSITLGELKQISDGTVIDVGSLYENKITLKVEGKPIARGELIIINDKYAVRVDEVLANNPPRQQAQPQPPRPQPQPQQRPPQPQQQIPPQQQNQGGDFDIEDENI